MMERTCPECGAGFQTTNSRQVFCRYKCATRKSGREAWCRKYMKAKVRHGRCKFFGGSMAHKRFGAQFCGRQRQSQNLYHVNKTVTLSPESCTHRTKSKRCRLFGREITEGDRIARRRTILAKSAIHQTHVEKPVVVPEHVDFSILEIEYRLGEYIEFLAERHGMTVDEIEALARTNFGRGTSRRYHPGIKPQLPEARTTADRLQS